VLEEIGCEGEIADDGLLSAGFWCHRHQVEAEELISMGEVVCSEKNSSFLLGPGHV
jgi:hypothetical protein